MNKVESLIQVPCTREGYIEGIKALGQSIIDDAEKILGDYENEHHFIREIEIKGRLLPGEIYGIEVNKKYNVGFMEAKK